MSASTESIIPENEAQRMAAVRRYEILDTPPDGAFDRITAIAARRCAVPIAIVSIVDSDRIWFKSRHGLQIEQMGRDPGLCASAILKTVPHILPDARLDPRALCNPLVAGKFGLRFYVGIPLTTHDGFNLGTLCVLDRDPHPIDEVQIEDLKDLATVVMDQMELRLSARRAVTKAELMAREIDHRIMNSLQFTSSMLIMQSRSQSGTEAAAQLEKAANRVAAVARVHRHFYLAEAETVSCIDFLRRLCADLSAVLERPIEVCGDEGHVPTASIQSIGLIVNELVTNAAKHGRGLVEVAYRINDTGHELRVSDEGEGLPPGFDPAAGRGLGMKVVTTLVGKLGGRLACGCHPRGRGACFTIAFAIAPTRAAIS